jgi:hypothetical protein
VTVLKAEVRRMHSDFYGNGQPGALAKLNSFIDTYTGAALEREKTEDKRHRQNTNRLNLILALAAVITVYLALTHH